MSFLLYLRRALSAEALKLKRTLAVWMVLIAPSVVVGLNFAMLIDRGGQYLMEADSAWLSWEQNILVFWALMMLPLFITLETALLGGVDHNSQQWKHICALPIPRWTLCAAKLIVAAILIGVSTLVLWGETIMAGLLLGAIRPEIPLGGPLPFGELLQPMLLIFLIAWCMIAVHQFVALRWQSFTFAIGFGITTAVINFMVIQSDKWNKFFPWSWPAYAFFEEGASFLPAAVALGMVGGVIVSLVGTWIVSRREVV
ncbi:MAG TPA: ABC transporter permease [Anaerolineae bacterium]|nr:ABC transporter permease [Anaerolineae bacterium]